MKSITLPHNFIPREYQQEYFDWFDHNGRFRIDVWHRRAGKDLTALHQTCKLAHLRRGMYWHCLPTYAQARKSVWNNFNNSTGERLLRSIFPPEIVKHPDEFRPQAEMLIELRNGSMIQLIGSDAIDSIVGTGPLHVTFSEYALCKPNSFDLVRPMLRQNGGSASFITTPRGKNHAYAMFQMAGKTPGWSRSVRTVYDTKLKYRSDADPSIMLDADAMMEEEAAAGMQKELIRQEYLCDWSAALVGSVYGDLLESIEKNAQIGYFDFGKIVFVSFDLGMNDSTAIWVGTLRGREGIDIIGHYENHAKPLDHYFEWVDNFCTQHALTLSKIWLPHDAEQTHVTGLSAHDQFAGHYGWGRVEIVRKLPVIQGVQAARWLLQQNLRIHQRCADGINSGVEALKQYHYEFDDARRTYTNRPEHDWSSHTADAFRYMATVIKLQRLIDDSKMKKPVEKVVLGPDSPIGPRMTMDQIWEQHKKDLAAKKATRRIV